LVGECLTQGSIFREEQLEHLAPGGESRLLGVTISPIRRGTEKSSGAICLLTDLTELAALQQQIQLKESLAAVGELSAGIAHEFKNALATISGYAQMISAEAVAGEVADSVGTDSRANAQYYACGDGIFEVCAAFGNFERASGAGRSVGARGGGSRGGDSTSANTI